MNARREARPASSFGATDVVGLVVVAAGLVAIWAIQLAVVPSFGGMFRDFGGELPALTLAVLRPIVASIATGIGVTLAAAGIALRLAQRSPNGALSIGTLAIGMAAFVPALTVPLMLYAMYLPIFALADAIQ